MPPSLDRITTIFSSVGNEDKDKDKDKGRRYLQYRFQYKAVVALHVALMEDSDVMEMATSSKSQ